jgi:hypothetical protein
LNVERVSYLSFSGLKCFLGTEENNQKLLPAPFFCAAEFFSHKLHFSVATVSAKTLQNGNEQIFNLLSEFALLITDNVEHLTKHA